MTGRLCLTRHEDGWRCKLDHGHDGKHQVIGATGLVIVSWWKNHGPIVKHWVERMATS